MDAELVKVGPSFVIKKENDDQSIPNLSSANQTMFTSVGLIKQESELLIKVKEEPEDSYSYTDSACTAQQSVAKNEEVEETFITPVCTEEIDQSHLEKTNALSCGSSQVVECACQSPNHYCNTTLSISSKADNFKCSKCDYKTDKKRNLTQHFLRHSSEVCFKCSECDYQTNLRAYLKQHLLSHSNVKNYKCLECDFRTNKKSNLSQHVLRHSDIEKNLKCSKCDYKTNKKKLLSQHTLTHSDVKKFECPQCGYRTNRKDHLSEHKVMHSSIKNFKCSLCDYKTSHKVNFSQHLWTHSDVKKLMCPKCNYRTNRKKDLNRHLSVHSDVKNLNCPHCDFTTRRKATFNNHLLTHSTNQISSLQCNFTTNIKGNLPCDMLSDSLIKILKCSDCDFKTSVEPELTQHLLTHSCRN